MTPGGRALRLAAAALLAPALAPALSAQEPESPREAARKHYELAVGFCSAGKTAEADVEISVALHEFDLDPRYHWLLGQVRMEQKRFAEAAECYARAAALDADEVGYGDDLRRAYEAAGDPEAALRALRTAAERSPQDVTVNLELGEALEALGRDDEAIRTFAKGIEIESRDARSFHALGRIYERRNAPDKALFYFEQAARLEPADAGARTRAAALYVTHRRDYAKAREILEPAFQADPHNLEYAKLLVRVYYGLELDDRAEDMREQAWGLANGVDGDLVIDAPRVRNETLTAIAPLRLGKGAPVRYEFRLGDDAGKPRRSFTLAQAGDGRYRLMEGERPVAEFGARPPDYRDTLDALTKHLNKEAPPPPEAKAAESKAPAKQRKRKGHHHGH